MPVLDTIDLTSHALATRIKTRAQEIGFDLAGIASAEPSRYREHLRRWLDDGQAGSMAYLTKRFDERTDPAVYMPGAASVICVAMNYHVPLEAVPESDRPAHGRIARYALGTDYHDLMKTRLHALADCVREISPGAQTRAAVDTAPLLERELAQRAGIGWIGKNTCIIHPRVGSYILLGEVLTSLPLPADEAVADHCGACTRCIDACPTQAITEPYQLDARRCISYLTIEHREDIPDDLKPAIGDWLYGCDICQEVCPHNRHAPSAIDPALQPRFPTGGLDVDDVLSWGDSEYCATVAKSAIKRAKLPMLQRNAQIVKANAIPRVTGPGE
jgi:epoxyqueuosine reductase